ncbi:hypothetical protein TI39_contig4372g00015 [Zymoseptoria brevis]|uniref:Uncharacterized protein n=1 Tax=Zymoseptoria brevis TaxID=1047168 RepID=A0A0F4G739_9PEZI|nr:hypothetical protein TI39_contig4372g00015 [Zymoseptoria brevis]
MRFGYASDWFGEELVKTRVSTIGAKLLKGLARARKSAPNRPLIFVAHSFGGLVVMSALWAAASSSAADHQIHDCAMGLVFLGTPFRGLHRSLSQGEVLLLSENPDVASSLDNLRVLQAGDGALIDLVNGYLSSAKGIKDRVTICVYEEKETNVAALVNKTVSKKVLLVDESSPTLDGCIKISRPCDHFALNKFVSPNLEAWEELAEALIEIKDKALNRSSTTLPTETSGGDTTKETFGKQRNTAECSASGKHSPTPSV